MAFNIAYTYQLIDKYSAPLGKIIAATRAHTRFLEENKRAMQASNTIITKMANRADRLAGSLKAVASSDALKVLTEQAKELNAQLDKMGRVGPMVPGGLRPGGRGPGGDTFNVGAREGRFSRFGAAASGLAGFGGARGMSAILRQTATLESAMIDLGRATDLPAAQLKHFEARFMTLSEEIGISTDKLAIMAFEGAKMGLPTAELERFVKLTANAAVAFELVEDEAGRALGSIKAKMGLSISGLIEMMDRINFVADNTSAAGGNMIEIIERLSGTFKTLKIPPEVAAGFAAVADQIETSPELAASGMNMVINRMMKSSTLAQQMVKAPAQTIRDVFTKLAKMPEAQRISAATKMFGDEAGRFAVKLSGSMELFENTMQKAAESRAIGSMSREMQSRLSSLDMLGKTIKNSFLNVLASIGEALAPEIKELGNSIRELGPKVREFIKEHPGLVKIAIAGAAILTAFALAGPIVMALGAAFSFVGAAAALITGPIAALAAFAALVAFKWGEWSESGHPLVEVIKSIGGRIGKLVGWVGGLIEKSGTASKVVGALSAAFDFLGVVLAIPLQALDQILWAIEKIIELAGKLSFDNIAAGAKDVARAMVPAPVRPLVTLGEHLFGGGSSEQSVNGTITVKAEPGTKAKVAQPNLPTGSNVRLAMGGAR